jgi:hypothetical protein
VERRRRPRREQGERGRRRRRLHQGRRRRVVVVVGVIGLPLEEAPAPARRGYGGGRRGRSRRGARRRGGHRGRPLVAPGLDLVVVAGWGELGSVGWSGFYALRAGFVGRMGRASREKE